MDSMGIGGKTLTLFWTVFSPKYRAKISPGEESTRLEVVGCSFVYIVSWEN